MTCGYQPENRDYAPCRRAEGHDGPCAHEFARPCTEYVAPAEKDRGGATTTWGCCGNRTRDGHKDGCAYPAIRGNEAHRPVAPATEPKCEGCDKPATHHDDDGVPLCASCFLALPVAPDTAPHVHRCINCVGTRTHSGEHECFCGEKSKENWTLPSTEPAPETSGEMRTFTMYRRGDLSATHTAGVHVNAPDEPQFEGVEFSDGTVAIRWLTAARSTSVWADLDTMLAVHGHPEARYGSELVFHDPGRPTEPAPKRCVRRETYHKCGIWLPCIDAMGETFRPTEPAVPSDPRPMLNEWASDAVWDELSRLRAEREAVINALGVAQEGGVWGLPAEPGPVECATLAEAVTKAMEIAENDCARLRAENERLDNLAQKWSERFAKVVTQRTALQTENAALRAERTFVLRNSPRSERTR